MSDIENIQISSWAAPTPEDIAVLKSLPDAQRQELVARQIEKGFESGISDMTKDDIWNEAVRRVKAKAHAPGAV